MKVRSTLQCQNHISLDHISLSSLGKEHSGFHYSLQNFDMKTLENLKLAEKITLAHQCYLNSQEKKSLNLDVYEFAIAVTDTNVTQVTLGEPK